MNADRAIRNRDQESQGWDSGELSSFTVVDTIHGHRTNCHWNVSGDILCRSRQTAGPSTPLRSGRDDNFVLSTDRILILGAKRALLDVASPRSLAWGSFQPLVWCVG